MRYNQCLKWRAIAGFSQLNAQGPQKDPNLAHQHVYISSKLHYYNIQGLVKVFGKMVENFGTENPSNEEDDRLCMNQS